MAIAAHPPVERHVSAPSAAALDRVRRTIARAARVPGSVVVLEGASGEARAGVLDSLAGSLTEVRRCLPVRAVDVAARGLVLAVVDAAGWPHAGSEHRALWDGIVRAALDGRPLVLVVDDADALSDTDLRTLLDWTARRGTRLALVLATTRYVALRDRMPDVEASLAWVRMPAAEAVPGIRSRARARDRARDEPVRRTTSPARIRPLIEPVPVLDPVVASTPVPAEPSPAPWIEPVPVLDPVVAAPPVPADPLPAPWIEAVPVLDPVVAAPPAPAEPLPVPWIEAVPLLEPVVAAPPAPAEPLPAPWIEAVPLLEPVVAAPPAPAEPLPAPWIEAVPLLDPVVAAPPAAAEPLPAPWIEAVPLLDPVVAAPPVPAEPLPAPWIEAVPLLEPVVAAPPAPAEPLPAPWIEAVPVPAPILPAPLSADAASPAPPIERAEPAEPAAGRPQEPARGVAVEPVARDRSAGVVAERAAPVTVRSPGLPAVRGAEASRSEVAAYRAVPGRTGASRLEAARRPRPMAAPTPRWAKALVAAAVLSALMALASFGQWIMAASRVSALLAAGRVPAIAQTPVARPVSAPPARDDGRRSAADAARAPRMPAVSSVEEAFVLASTDPRPEAQAAARAFLDRHGPDARAYELLAELDAQRADSPEQSVAVLERRSRARRLLCSVWADDPLGEAPVKLGCPGAPPPVR